MAVFLCMTSNIVSFEQPGPGVFKIVGMQQHKLATKAKTSSIDLNITLKIAIKD